MNKHESIFKFKFRFAYNKVARQISSHFLAISKLICIQNY